MIQCAGRSDLSQGYSSYSPPPPLQQLQQAPMPVYLRAMRQLRQIIFVEEGILGPNTMSTSIKRASVVPE